MDFQASGARVGVGEGRGRGVEVGRVVSVADNVRVNVTPGSGTLASVPEGLGLAGSAPPGAQDARKVSRNVARNAFLIMDIIVFEVNP
jgi:hypothetical protein